MLRPSQELLARPPYRRALTNEQCFNRQNDLILARTISETKSEPRLVTRIGHPTSAMVWAAITSTGKTTVVFIEQGVKQYSRICQESILEKVVLPLDLSHFNG